MSQWFIGQPIKRGCVIALKPPPPHWGFKRSRAGTSWYILLAAHRVPACLAALRKRGIRCHTAWPPHPDSNWWPEFWRELARRRQSRELTAEEWRSAQFLWRYRDRVKPHYAARLIAERESW